jgi:hypothetical protein
LMFRGIVFVCFLVFVPRGAVAKKEIKKKTAITRAEIGEFYDPVGLWAEGRGGGLCIVSYMMYAVAVEHFTPIKFSYKIRKVCFGRERWQGYGIKQGWTLSMRRFSGFMSRWKKPICERGRGGKVSVWREAGTVVACV